MHGRRCGSTGVTESAMGSGMEFLNAWNTLTDIRPGRCQNNLLALEEELLPSNYLTMKIGIRRCHNS
jgi:hypothetical protein